MSAYFAIYGIVAAGIVICFLGDSAVRRIAQRVYLGAVMLILPLFAAMRSPNVDKDFHDYVLWFRLIRAGNAPWFAWARDPAFAALSYVVSRFGLSYQAVEFVYALLGLLVTWMFAVMAAERRWITLFFYLLFCQYFIVLEMTEIRSAVGIPLMACSLLLACERRRWQAVGTFAVALVFHFSAIVALPILVLLLCGVEFRSRGWVWFLAGIGTFTAIAMRSVVDLLSSLYRVSEYLNGGVEEHDLRVISWYALGHLLVIVIPAFFLWKRLSLHERVATIGCTAGLMLFVVFGWNTGLATRLLYVFDVYWLFIMMMILWRLKGEARVIFACVLAVAGLALYCKSLQYVDPYTTVEPWDASLHLPAEAIASSERESALPEATAMECAMPPGISTRSIWLRDVQRIGDSVLQANAAEELKP
jgi:hypothetical protein